MVLFFLIFIAVTTASPIQAQDIQAQDNPIGGNVQVGGDVGYQPAAAGQQAGQYQNAGDQPVDVADIDGDDSDELTAFDPSTIPDAAPTPDADWLFEVPIDVEGISQEVQQLGVVCEVFEFWVDPYDPTHTGKTTYGKNKKKIDLEHGAYHGNVLIGINFNGRPNREPHQAEKYTCWVYIVGSDSHWYVPKKKRNVTPEFRRMSKKRPFRWQTGPVSIPPDARLPAP